MDKLSLKLRASLVLELRYQRTAEGTVEQLPVW